MLDKTKFYIDGQWVAPIEGTDFPVINPATEEAYATISLGGAKDAEVAIAAAKAAFSAWSFTTVETRIQYLENYSLFMKTACRIWPKQFHLRWVRLLTCHLVTKPGPGVAILRLYPGARVT